MALENITLTMGIFMKECGLKIKDTAKEFTTTRMVKFIEVGIGKVKEKVMGLLTIRTEIDMKVNGLMETLKDSELIIIALAKCIWVITKTIKEMAKEDISIKTE